MELEALAPQVWESLSARIPRSGSMAPMEQLVCSGAAEPMVLICTSRDKSFHLMLDLPAKSKDKLDSSKHAGLSVGILSDHLVRNHGRRNLIDVRCTASPHLPAFTAIAREVGYLVLRDSIHPIEAVNRTIRKWRSFWGKPSAGILSEEQQLGLLMELEVLRCLIGSVGAQAVDAWKGPLGFRHDFALPSVSLEVKATVSAKRCHIINGIDQLQPLAGSDLFLVSWLGSRVMQGGTTLAEGADSVASALKKDPAAFEIFQERLAAAGYTPAHIEFYRDTRFAVGTGKIFPVAGDFPRLSTEHLKQPLSPRVLNVAYSVNLDGLKSWEFGSWCKRRFVGRTRVS